MRKIFLILALLFTGLSFSQEDNKSKSLSDAPPTIKKYVVDETGTLSSSEINSLMSKLIDFEKQTSNQIVVYIIQSLGGEPIENVANEIARKNKIGKKDKNNGVLVLIAMKDRQMRIEVGYGLEGALTDAICSQIINKEMKPSFREGDYYEGIDQAVNSIIAATKGEYKGDGTTGKKKKDYGAYLIIFIVFGFIFFSVIISIIRRIFGFGRGMITGRRGSRFGGFGTGFLAGSLFNSDWGSSGSSGSSGSDFGGFSGGGGDFGGGGSSGSW
ncbi:MAG: TPM domain-containing protein [Ignavibacteria bacterium]|nr:TPM domain-containing protein [Ignavibacteria bacterium]